MGREIAEIAMIAGAERFQDRLHNIGRAELHFAEHRLRRPNPGVHCGVMAEELRDEEAAACLRDELVTVSEPDVRGLLALDDQLRDLDVLLAIHADDPEAPGQIGQRLGEGVAKRVDADDGHLRDGPVLVGQHLHADGELSLQSVVELVEIVDDEVPGDLAARKPIQDFLEIRGRELAVQPPLFWLRPQEREGLLDSRALPSLVRAAGSGPQAGAPRAPPAPADRRAPSGRRRPPPAGPRPGRPRSR
jgi:hypothetical protein